MSRVAFLLRLKPGTGPDYDRAHREVWPEMLALLKRAGLSEYSIFRRDELLCLTFQTDNFERSWAIVESDPVNTKWQEAMSAYFAPVEGLRSGERFPMMEEVFFLP
jgi:L-rhamnose mutarotase